MSRGLRDAPRDITKGSTITPVETAYYLLLIRNSPLDYRN